jgi:large subunit ribosomal protein L10
VLEFKGGLMGGQELTVDEIKSLARLPARDMLYGQLVGTVASPLTGLVRGLNALIAGLPVQLQQIADKGLLPKGAASEGEAAPAEEPEPGGESEQQTEQEADASADAQAEGDEPDQDDAAEAKEEA